jgi:F420-dependent oxidoreductase-like protein
MKLSLLYPETRSVDRVIALAQETEALGFHGMFLGTAFGFDPIMALAFAGSATSRLQLGVAVVPTWPRHPLVMAQQAATANQVSRGRFRLGIGPSHIPVMQRYGIEFDRPISHLREYLTIVRALLADGKVAHEGERYRVQGMLDVAAPDPLDEGGCATPPVLLAALREQMCRLAGSHADGVLPWLPPLGWFADSVVPNVRAGAAAVGRATPTLFAELPAALARDREAVHAMAAKDLFIYPKMPFYRGMLEAAGVAGAAESPQAGWSDAMIDAAILWGDEDTLARKIRGYLDAGADEVVLSPFGVGDDPAASARDLVRVLADIAKN